MGSGKSFAGALKSLDLAVSNPGHPGIVWAPTIRDAREGVIKTAVQILRGEHESGFEIPIQFDYNKSNGTITLFPNGRNGRSSEIIVRSGEQDVVGTNAAWALADELDTLSKSKARHAWQQLTQRVRAGSLNQMCVTTTPEGFRFMWEFFKKDPAESEELSKSRRLITASLLTNPNVPDSYIHSLLDTHSAQEIRARIYGEFVNMNSGSVYPDYDQDENHTDLTLETLPSHITAIHIGIDFNVVEAKHHPHGIAAICAVVMNNTPYVIEEIYGCSQTSELIKKIKARFPGKTILAYPDATAEGSRTSAAESDRAQLRNAGFVDLSPPGNPRVKDRVSAVNALLKNGLGVRRLKVNRHTCPILSSCLTQQPYDDNGDPEKNTGFDDPNDALGYFVNVRWPITESGGSFQARLAT